jgi:hypothetical protein
MEWLGLLLLVVRFALPLFAGFALLVVGAVKLPGGRQVRALPGRLAGFVFLAFLPLFFGARALRDALELRDTVEPYQDVIDWALYALCMICGCGIIWWASRPPREERRRATPTVKRAALSAFPDANANPFSDAVPPPAAEAPRAARGKKSAPRPPQNPFDF